MSMLRAFTTVGSYTTASRILGFTRDVLMARFLGAGLVADCFFIAFKLPNFFRRLFAEGAFSSAFVPLFAKTLGNRETAASQAAAKKFAEEALSVLLLCLIALTCLMQAFMPWAMLGLAPGFADDPQKFTLAIELTRLTFPYLLLISLVSLFAGILNALHRFAAAAAAPILLNLVLITSLVVFHQDALITARALAIAVTVAGIAQFLFLFFAARRAGFALFLPMPRLSPAVRRLLRTMLPVALGAGVMQVNLVVDIVLASLLPEGSLSYLFYADRLNQLPLGVIGIAVATVLLPKLSRTLAGGAFNEANAQHNRAIEFALLLTVPAAFALALIPEPLIRALFEHGAFSAEDAQKAALALSAYAAGLPAFVLVKVLVPGFYAREDMKTPVRFAIFALITNIVLNLILMGPLLHMGLALATSLAAWLNAGLLFFTLIKRGDLVLERPLKRHIIGIFISAGLMGALVFSLSRLFALPASAGTWPEVMLVAALIAAGLITYAVCITMSGVVKLTDLKGYLARKG